MSKLYNGGASFGFSLNYNTAVPVDTRMVVSTSADLKDPRTWVSGTYDSTTDANNVYVAYPGMLVAVVGEKSVYQFTSQDVTGITLAADASWTKLASSSVATDLSTLEGRVDTIEGLINADEDRTINKVNEILAWFAGLDDDALIATELIADVAANKSAIGVEAVAGTPDKLEGDEGYVAPVAASGLYAKIEEAKLAAINAQHSKTTVTKGTANGTISVDSGADITIYEEVANTVHDENYSHITVSSTDGVSDADGNTYKYQAEEGTVVDTDYKHITVTESSVSDGTNTFSKFTTNDETKLSVKEGSSDYLGVNDHEVEAKVVNLADTVGMVKNADGTWSAGTATALANGLANAADIAAEIIADEQVVAAALNEHETKIGSENTAAEGETSNATGLYKKIEEAKEAAIAALHSKTTVETGDRNGTISVDGENVSVYGLGSAAYTDSSEYDAAGAAAEILGNTFSTVKDLEDIIGVASKAAVGTEDEEGYEAPVAATGLQARIESLESNSITVVATDDDTEYEDVF